MNKKKDLIFSDILKIAVKNEYAVLLLYGGVAATAGAEALPKLPVVL